MTSPLQGKSRGQKLIVGFDHLDRSTCSFPRLYRVGTFGAFDSMAILSVLGIVRTARKLLPETPSLGFPAFTPNHGRSAGIEHQGGL